MFIERAQQGAIAILTLNHAARRNALSLELMRELTLALKGLEHETRAVILAAEGPAFSAGHDLREMRGRSLEDYQVLFDACTDLMRMVQTIPQPVIAEVQGVATAAGCQLVAACDLAIAADTATIAIAARPLVTMDRATAG